MTSDRCRGGRRLRVTVVLAMSLATFPQTATGAAAGVDPTVSAEHAAAADAAERSWTWLAGQVGWSDASALRRRLPGVSPVAIEWLRAAMDADRIVLEQPGVTADSMLAEPAHQLMRKALGEVTAVGFAAAAIDTEALTKLTLGTGSGDPDLQALDAALWDSYGGDLAEYAPLREETGAGTTTFLWIRHAAEIDQDALGRLRVSVHDLLHMADYQLARKLAADSHVQSLVACVRCATPSATYYGDECRARDSDQCSLPAANDPDMLCATYISRVVHPAGELAHCPGRTADIPTVPQRPD